GGMGIVYLARDTKLGRLVAIKVLTRLTGPSARRFVIEARHTASCEHQNIVVIHEIDVHEGCPYMVLEYIEGQSLREWMTERRIVTPDRKNGEGPMIPVPASLAVELMVPVVRALAFAHKRKIVHRDLKPENIMFKRSFETTTFDALGRLIKVVDFGIAK